MVDWSAHSAPKTGRDSIWIGHGRTAGGRATVSTFNPPTRALAFRHLLGVVGDAIAGARTVLVGFDFSFGYPEGFASCTARLGPATAAIPGPGETVRDPGPEGLPPWRHTWDLLSSRVTDGADNANDRFVVAERINRQTGRALFWGRPAGPRHFGLLALPVRREVPCGLQPNPCDALRIVERRAGPGIKSNFQLFGGVTVGSQVLLGVPYLSRLLRHFGDAAAVWPFETGFAADPLGSTTRVIVAEIWPSTFGLGRHGSLVRDEGQVVSVVRGCLAREATGWREWFCPPGVRDLGDRRRTAVVGEEGWILGVE